MAKMNYNDLSDKIKEFMCETLGLDENQDVDLSFTVINVADVSGGNKATDDTDLDNEEYEDDEDAVEEEDDYEDDEEAEEWDKKSLNKLDIVELKQVAKDQGISIRGRTPSKSVLIDKILEAGEE